MRFIVAAVGRPRNAALAAAIHEYETRAARYWPLTVVEVKEERGAGKRPPQVRAREAERLRAAIPRGAALWACDVGGTQRTSEEFARFMQRTREAVRDVVICIGGAFGLDDALRAEALAIISLGPLTFSHELARLVLAEQVYRAGTIVRGEPYHK